ncbi:hypothetical protein GCM10023322_59210 [Rugosimonospora acidiphila]|uniref:TfuA-like core domain-containing protein n=1 Tax=Rugosimonospora acidiphila TaxID=556531 RepID=A0ABP9SFP9_9ACTN
MTSRLLVYIGPTLGADEVLRIAPDAEIRPPVENGMLVQARPRPGDVIVLIDGYYRDRLAVRHKEIMTLIQAGVVVVGAASMGALRAAELSDHGMIGVGRVYQMYKDGEIVGDDEVAVKHSPAERGYRADSLALVNLRHGGGLAVSDGVARASTVAALVSAARELVFFERTWPRLTAAVTGRCCAEDLAEIPALAEYCGRRACDLKAQDAVLAIERATRLRAGSRGTAPGAAEPAASRAVAPAASRAVAPAAPRAVAPAVRPDGGPTGDGRHDPPRWRTNYLRDWVTYWGSAEQDESGDWISDVDVLHAARLYDDGYPDVHDAVLTELMTEMAAGRGSINEYMMSLMGMSGTDQIPHRFTALLSAEECRLSIAEQVGRIVFRVWPANICRDWRALAIAKLKDHPSWPQWRATVREAAIARRTSGKAVQDGVAALIFLHRWGVSGPAVPRELGRRGFLTFTGLDQVAGRFAPLELRKRRDVARLEPVP